VLVHSSTGIKSWLAIEDPTYHKIMISDIGTSSPIAIYIDNLGNKNLSYMTNGSFYKEKINTETLSSKLLSISAGG